MDTKKPEVTVIDGRLTEEEYAKYWRDGVELIRKLDESNFTPKERSMIAQAIGIAQGVMCERLRRKG